MEGAAEVAAEEEGLGLHVDVGGVFGEGSHFVRKENSRRVQVFAHAVPHHSPELLYLFLSHFYFLAEKMGYRQSGRASEAEKKEFDCVTRGLI